MDLRRAHRRTDTAGGYGYRLRHNETGDEREFSILIAAGPSQVTGSHVNEVLNKYLDDPDPPRRVTLDREGREIGSG